MSERKKVPQGGRRKYTVCDWIHGIALVCTVCLAVFDVIRYGMLGKAVPVLTVILVEAGLLLEAEPRLRTGINTDFDIFPMRYHFIGSWHLALYNYLQRIF